MPAQEDPDALREIRAGYPQITPAIVGDLTLPRCPAEVDRDSVETLVELGVEDGPMRRRPGRPGTMRA